MDTYSKCRELIRNSQTCEKQKIKKTHTKKKNNHTHKTVFTWFYSLLMELQRFYYYQEKIQSVAVQFFSLSKTTTTNFNHKSNVF